MKKVTSILAYIWAFVCLLLIPLTFAGNEPIAKQIARLPFMKVNPKYSGGDLAYEYKSDSLIIAVNKPVFAALFGESSTGFVQVKFSQKNQLPQLIAEKIDYNRDGIPDFMVRINTQSGETQLEKFNRDVREITASSKVKSDWIVRVGLANSNK